MSIHYDVHCDFIKKASVNFIRYTLSLFLAMAGMLIAGIVWYGIWYVMYSIYSDHPFYAMEAIFCGMGWLGTAVMAVISVVEAYE